MQHNSLSFASLFTFFKYEIKLAAGFAAAAPDSDVGQHLKNVDQERVRHTIYYSPSYMYTDRIGFMLTRASLCTHTTHKKRAAGVELRG